MALFTYSLLPLFAIAALLIFISLIFCVYLYSMRRLAESQKGFKYTKFGSMGLFTTHRVCPICLEEFQIGLKIARCHCGHSFHVSCLLPWLKLHSTCPMCKKNLRADQPLTTDTV